MKTCVIIPCHYKHFQLIHDLLLNYLNQSTKPDEIIISLSESDEILPNQITSIESENWPFHLSILKHKEKLSAGQNRNRAFSASESDLFIFQDADDIPHPQRIEIIKQLFENFEIDHLMHPWLFPKDSFKKISGKEAISLCKYVRNFQEVIRADRFTYGNVSCLKKVLNTIKWPEMETRGEDEGFNQAVYKKYNNTVTLDIPLLIYRNELSAYRALFNPECSPSLKTDLKLYPSISTLKQQLNLSQQEIQERGRKELGSFVSARLWKHGYFEGNPKDPFGASSYKHMQYKGYKLSPLYVCYRQCVFPYVKDKDVLEIGPGRGAWTKEILALNPKTVTCVDSLSAEHNEFWKYIGDAPNTRYFQISDFSLSDIEDNSIDYVFSFGVFCHITPLLIQEYLKNLYPKLRAGALCFISYADFGKYAEYYQNTYNDFVSEIKKEDESLHYSQEPRAGRWYHLGIDRADQLLTELGYRVVSPDIGSNERDPLMFFIKP